MQAIGPIAEQPLAQFEQVLDTNCTGAVRMMQAVTPGMFKQVQLHAVLPTELILVDAHLADSPCMLYLSMT